MKEAELAAAKAAACAAVDAAAGELVALSHDIHDHPELAFREHHAARRLTTLLRRGGLAVQPGAFGLATSFTADAGSDGPRIVLCCEYDALPGLGHGCGHNVIGAASAGAGLALAPLAARGGGRVTILGTPAEESGGGKILLGDRGAFAGAAAAMLVHPSSYEVIVPHIGALATLEVQMLGRAAHAALFPEQGINALDAMVVAYTGLAALRQHLGPSDKAHGIFTDGGQVASVVPARAAGRFLVRSAQEAGLEALQERVLACFGAGAQATGAQMEHRWLWPTYLEMWHNMALAAAFEVNLRRLGRRPQAPTSVPSSRSASTDMGNVSHLLPTIHPKLKVGPDDVVQHTPGFARWTVGPAADQAVVDGAKALAMTTLDVWMLPPLRTAMEAEFSARASAASARTARRRPVLA